VIGGEHATVPRVVIVGGGFGGLYAARSFGRANVEVVVIDRRNHHLFQPLLYQVATAALSAPDIAAPIRRILRKQKNVRVLMKDVASVDVDGKRVLFDDGALGYDFLILAPGARDNYFDHDDWSRHALGLKTIKDALRIRNHLLLAYEAAERETDPVRRGGLLTFVVVGGGPTGVEMAGSMAEIARHTLARDFRSFDPRSARVILAEGGERILPGYPEDLSSKAQAQLESLGVEVRTGTRVTDLRKNEVTMGGGETIGASLLVWAAGVQAESITRTLGVPLDSTGRVEVEEALAIPGRSDVFVIGDAAAVRVAGTGASVPGVAPAAIQMGHHAARSVLRMLAGRQPMPFRYRDKGSLATIGRSAAVAHVGRLRVSGLIAWLMWLFVHVFFLIGFRNRFVVLFEWAWAYLTYQRSARVILDEEDEDEDEGKD